MANNYIAVIPFEPVTSSLAQYDTLQRNGSGQWVNISPPRYRFVFAADNNTAWTNMPLALTEYRSVNGRNRQTVNLLSMTQWRLQLAVSVAGAANSVLGVQYSVNAGSNWAGLDNGTDATNSTVTAAADISANTTGAFTSWASIIAAARIDGVILRIAGAGGDGAVDPVFSQIIMEVR